MTNYTKSTNFASKDSLASGNPLKIVKGTEIDSEFNSIATAVATKADSISPTFIGLPTAPTAAIGTSSIQLATTAFVTAANALQDTAIALKAPLASPALTGTPTAPTAAVDTNTTQLATTAFVIAQAATATPLVDGTAAVGTSTKYAREDHKHPSPIITSGTKVATTSGTIFTFGAIPSTVKRVTMMLAGVSTNGSSVFQVRLGPSGGLETSGYVGQAGAFGAAGATGVLSSSVGVPLTNAYAANQLYSGAITFSLLDATTNTWIISSVIGNSSNLMTFAGFSKSLAGTLTQVSLSTQNGTDVFNAGSLNILYE